MSEETGQEKTEQPTGRRLEQAVEEGQILTSRDLVMAMVLLVGCVQFYLFGRYYYSEIRNAFSFSLDLYNPLVRDLPLTHVLADRFASAIILLLAFALPIMVAAIGTQVGLGGFHFVWKNIMPKGSRLSPIKGITRMFGSHGLIELGKSIVKVIVVGLVGYIVLKGFVPDVLRLSLIPFETAVEQSGDMLIMMLLILVGSIAVLGGADAFLQWYQHRQRLLMTRQEIKDEMKQTEGSPEVKNRIRRLQQEVSQRKSVTNVAEAQVIIVNPEHFAVALRYDFEEGAAPKVLSKGTDKIAQNIREKAEELGIPILEMPLLARALYYTTEIGGEIRAELYRAVATVLSFVLNAGAQGDMPDVEVPDEMQFDAHGRKLEKRP
jgi:flagellar biosynthetic protein FlhB